MRETALCAGGQPASGNDKQMTLRLAFVGTENVARPELDALHLHGQPEKRRLGCVLEERRFAHSLDQFLYVRCGCLRGGGNLERHTLYIRGIPRSTNSAHGAAVLLQSPAAVVDAFVLLVGCVLFHDRSEQEYTRMHTS